MNPPFGKASQASEKYLTRHYLDNWKDMYACFIERAIQLAPQSGRIGAITSSLFLYSKQLKQLRHELITLPLLETLVELGSGVLDTATVDTALSILARHTSRSALFADATSQTDKEEYLQSVNLDNPTGMVPVAFRTFLNLANSPLCYHVQQPLLHSGRIIELLSQTSLRSWLGTIRLMMDRTVSPPTCRGAAGRSSKSMGVVR